MRGETVACCCVTLMITYLHLPDTIDCQSIPIAINSDSPPGYNGSPFRPPPQSPSFSPLSAILGNLFGGLSSFGMSQSPSGGGQPPQGFISPGFNGETVEWQRDHRPQSQIECRESALSSPPPQLPPHRPTMANGFPSGHLSKSFKNIPDYTNSIDPLMSNRSGICVNTPHECKNRHGTIVGTCFTSRGSHQRVPIGVCCNIEASCNQIIYTNGSHFKSPKFPNPYSEPGTCSVTVKNTYNNVCQIRLDFDVFNLKQPVNGNCNSDRFIVSGQPNHIVVPSICGYNPGQHMYIDVDEKDRDSFRQSSPPTLLTLNVISTGMRHRWFDIRVSYIPCDSEYRAPTNCLQYFTSMVGQVKSFNYDMFNQGFTYFNNLDYTICFRKWAGFCTVTYEVPQSDEWGENSNDGDFNLPDTSDLADYDEQLKKGPPVQVTTSSSNSSKNRKKYKQQLRPGREGTSFHIITRDGTQSQTTAAAGPLKCNTDYLAINNLRFCGHHLNEAGLYSSSVRVDSPVMDNSTGPLHARFVTSSDTVGKGFVLNYQLNACLMAG